MSHERSNAILDEICRMARELPTGSANAIINRANKVRSRLNKGLEYKDQDEVQDLLGSSEAYRYQRQMVLDYLLRGNTITSLDAFRLFGITRLSAVIFDIEKVTGRAPNRRKIQVENRYGRTTWVCEYWIDQDHDQASTEIHS